MISQNDRIRRRFRVTGIVQGVGFRFWTVRTAEPLGLRGTVRNCRDGSVEVEAEGDPDAVSELERRLRRGPSPARVDAVREETAGTAPLPNGFTSIR